jgi:hypothetical protein
MHQGHPLLLVVDDETTVLRYISNLCELDDSSSS